MERSESHVLCHFSREHGYRAAGLTRVSHVVETAIAVRSSERTGEIGIVAYLIEREAETRARLGIVQHALSAKMVYHGQVVGTPPKVARLVMAKIERWFDVMVESGSGKRHGVAKEREVEVNASVYLDLSDIVSQESHVACDIEVKALSLGLAELRANRHAILIPRRGAHRVGQHIVA